MSTATAPNTLTAQSPWPGLRSFGEDDREFFFGRERETAELLALVQRSGVVIVYGQSGLGKTSLLQAGLVAIAGGVRRVSRVRCGRASATRPPTRTRRAR